MRSRNGTTGVQGADLPSGTRAGWTFREKQPSISVIKSEPIDAPTQSDQPFLSSSSFSSFSSSPSSSSSSSFSSSSFPERGAGGLPLKLLPIAFFLPKVIFLRIFFPLLSSWPSSVSPRAGPPTSLLPPCRASANRPILSRRRENTYPTLHTPGRVESWIAAFGRCLCLHNGGIAPFRGKMGRCSMQRARLLRLKDRLCGESLRGVYA